MKIKPVDRKKSEHKKDYDSGRILGQVTHKNNIDMTRDHNP